MTPNDKKFVAFVATVVIIFTAALVVKEVARINPLDQEEPEQSEQFKQEPSDKAEEYKVVACINGVTYQI